MSLPRGGFRRGHSRGAAANLAATRRYASRNGIFSVSTSRCASSAANSSGASAIRSRRKRIPGRVAASSTPDRAKPQASAPANRLGIVVGELSAEQKKGLGVSYGLVVTDVRPDSKADVRKGDVLLTVVHKGQHTELRSVEQFNKLLAGLDRNSVITLQVRRGESTAFVTISGLTDKG